MGHNHVGTSKLMPLPPSRRSTPISTTLDEPLLRPGYNRYVFSFTMICQSLGDTREHTVLLKAQVTNVGKACVDHHLGLGCCGVRGMRVNPMLKFLPRCGLPSYVLWYSTMIQHASRTRAEIQGQCTGLVGRSCRFQMDIYSGMR